MRTFISIDLDEELREAVKRVQESLSEAEADVKFVKPENLHLTVKFIGEVHETREIESALSRVVKNFTPFKISLESVGFFGSPRHARTLWIGVHEGKEKLVNLIKALNDSLSHLRREKRKHEPHLTIGRVKSSQNMEKLLHMIKGVAHVKLGEMLVKEIKLKESALHAGGPVYSDLIAFKLGDEKQSS